VIREGKHELHMCDRSWGEGEKLEAAAERPRRSDVPCQCGVAPGWWPSASSLADVGVLGPVRGGGKPPSPSPRAGGTAGPRGAAAVPRLAEVAGGSPQIFLPFRESLEKPLMSFSICGF